MFFFVGVVVAAACVFLLFLIDKAVNVYGKQFSFSSSLIFFLHPIFFYIFLNSGCELGIFSNFDEFTLFTRFSGVAEQLPSSHQPGQKISFLGKFFYFFLNLFLLVKN